MKDLGLKLALELLRNSGRSDRELAKALGVSQPTVSRLLKKLKQDGIVREYTVIVDFRQLGIEIVAFTFGKWSVEKIRDFSDKERVEKARKFLSDHPNAIYASSGQGLRKERIVVSLHRNYSDYAEFIRGARAEWAGLVDLESFIISLNTDISPIGLSFGNIGKYLEKKD